MANLIVTAGANRVLAVDLHAPAIQGFFDIPVDNLTAVPLLADRLIDEHHPNVVIVSPDSGGVSRASEFRDRVGAGLAIIAKSRPEPDVAEMLEMVGEVEGKIAVIVDDMISTGGTLVEATDKLLDRGARCVLAYAVHAILADDALDVIRRSEIAHVVVTDTISVPEYAAQSRIEAISIAPLIASAIRRIHEGSSVSALFQASRFRQELLI
jgi:ribose-phosphate pyrophosphokinase